MRLRYAVFPVAGLGTRLLPATKVLAKEMLPIIDRPLLQYAVDEAVAAGCDTLVFVSNRYKHSIQDYFDTAYELEHRLTRGNKHAELQSIRTLLPAGVTPVFVTQQEALGLEWRPAAAQLAIDFFPEVLFLPENTNADETVAEAASAVMISAAASAAMTAGRLSFTASPPIGETSLAKSALLPPADFRYQLRNVAFFVFEPIMPT